MVSITVARKLQSFVLPMAPASAETLELSAIDRVPGLRHTVRSLHVFRQKGSRRADGARPAEVIRAALSRALVEYPAFAGHAPIRYTFFVLNLYQVTDFTCGGFVVGLVAVHTLADGLGAAQFINAVAELARGLDRPTVAPVWARAVIPNPPKLPSGPPPSFQSFGFHHFTTDVSSDHIAQVKTEYFQAMGQYCSTFDVAIAKALPKGGGFYGNCFYPVTVTATAEDVVTAGLLGVIKMIRDGKARLPSEFAKWASGDVKVDPYQLTFEHNVLFVSDWTRLGFFEVDYGWGAPSHIIPFTYPDYMAVAVLGAPPMPTKGTRIMTQCVEDKHLEEFTDEMKCLF
ncbi:unnamed protein product [Alopecurus aequalis]